MKIKTLLEQFEVNIRADIDDETSCLDTADLLHIQDVVQSLISRAISDCQAKVTDEKLV